MDLSCAFLLLRTLSDTPQWALCLLLYNFCAFALQMPLGLLADHLNRSSLIAAAGCGLTALAFSFPLPLAASAAAGTGNALFHLGGGIDVLHTSQKKAAALGVFVSPGALGLYIGTLWGRAVSPSLVLAPCGLLLLAAAILWCRPRFSGDRHAGNAPLSLTASGGYGAILPLFLVVVLRSYMGMSQSFPWKGQWAFVLTLALALGKTAGGFVMDKLGPQRASAVSLGLAAALYLASAFPLPGLLAVFLFNMTMPVTLWAMARVLPDVKGFAFGLLTFGLFLGYLPSYLGWPGFLPGPAGYSCAALLSLALLWLPLRKGAGVC